MNQSKKIGAYFQTLGLRKALTYFTVAVLLVLAISVAGKDFAAQLATLEQWIATLGPIGILAFVCVFVLATTLLVPEAIFGIMAGALFGMTLGLSAVIAGTLIASTLQFALARKLLKRQIDQALLTRPGLAAIQRAVLRDELKYQAMLRLTPLNAATTSYLLGAAGVRFWSFLVACLGIIPHLVFEVYFGYVGKHAAHMAGGGADALVVHDIVIFVGLLVALTVLAVISRMAHRAVMEAAEK
ncbi:MAG: TVP38/TMEM64 family protein [Woeseia sp.]|nr:VTT domain-containing protein [Woeseia sp.]NNE59715.1 TVP38/TMEM64 family protein [Woeseia sp.]